MPPIFSRLVRFLAADGKIYYGEAAGPGTPTACRIVRGDIFDQTRPTMGTFTGTNTTTTTIDSDAVPVVRLLCPLSPRTTVRTVRGIGLNYARHAAEAGLPAPTDPIVFHKPASAVPDSPDHDILVPRSLHSPVVVVAIPPGRARSTTTTTTTEGEGEGEEAGRGTSELGLRLDYECELVVIIGRAGRDISPTGALNHVLGYAVGNDVSERSWQLGPRGGGQWSFGKSFDTFAPLGPQVVTPAELARCGADPAAGGLRITTRLNGVVVQDSNTSDLIFDVPHLVAHLSRGTTLLPGDVIFTGTPAGVAMGMQTPRWLRHGDVVEVELERVGKCTNRVVFEGVDEEGKQEAGEERTKAKL